LGRFVVFSVLGSLPWNAALIYAGFVVGENYPLIEEALKPYEYVIYVAVLAGVAYLGWRWYRSRQTDEQTSGGSDAG
jgi:membrane protein DedA with SNARE-associated domain